MNENRLLTAIGCATFLTFMGYSSFIILGPGSVAPFLLLIGIAVTLALLVLYRMKNYSLRKALGAIGLGIFLALVYFFALVVIGTSMIQSVLPPP